MGTVSQASLNMKAFVIVSAGFGQDDVAFLDILMMTVIMISTIIIITIIIFIIIMIMIMTNPIQVALVAAVAGEADPYTIGQVLAGQTNGGVITSTTYHGGVKVAGFPYTTVAAAVPHTYGSPYAYAPYAYGKREAEAEPEPWTVGQIAAGAHVAEAIKDGRPHNVGVITNAAIAPVAATHLVSGYSAYPYAYSGYPYHAVYGKREAEANPALLYSTGVAAYHPYALGAHAVTYAGAPHAVAYTPFGVTHSSNVGICTNVEGAQVPCRRKRESDPALVYTAGAAVPYGAYGVLPYAGVHGTNPVHAVAYTGAGLTHSSNVGICTNYVGAVVPC